MAEIRVRMRRGTRAWTMARVINVREGFTRKDDAIPEEWFEPFRTADGKEHILQDYYKQKVLTREDLTGFLDDYYEERDWDRESGIPKAEKLLELGLNELIGDIQAQRKIFQ